LYLKDTALLREETRADFNRRFYVAHNKEEFDKYMARYAKGELLSKFSLELVHNYAFPVDDADVGETIAQMIRKQIERTPLAKTKTPEDIERRELAEVG
jgi:hypothetical protein